MSRRTIQGSLIAAAGAAVLQVAMGQGDPMTPETPDVPDPASAPTETAPQRDPFWPIGWRPPHLERPDSSGDPLDEQARWEVAIQQIQVAGLSQKTDGGYLAILKGAGLVEKGDLVSVEYDSLIYTWRIAEITSEGIFPEQVDVTRKK